MKKNKGFTLIELLAVIVILGILLSISVVAVNKIRKNQEEENKENVISSILTGAKEYNADNKINGSVEVKDLLAGNYTDFDENKYSNLINSSVKKEACDNSIKYKYFITVGSVTYNDCGCESQADYSVEGTLTNDNKICKESNLN